MFKPNASVHCPNPTEIPGHRKAWRNESEIPKRRRGRRVSRPLPFEPCSAVFCMPIPADRVSGAIFLFFILFISAKGDCRTDLKLWHSPTAFLQMAHPFLPGWKVMVFFPLGFGSPGPETKPMGRPTPTRAHAGFLFKAARDPAEGLHNRLPTQPGTPATSASACLLERI